MNSENIKRATSKSSQILLQDNFLHYDSISEYEIDDLRALNNNKYQTSANIERLAPISSFEGLAPMEMDLISSMIIPPYDIDNDDDVLGLHSSREVTRVTENQNFSLNFNRAKEIIQPPKKNQQMRIFQNYENFKICENSKKIENPEKIFENQKIIQNPEKNLENPKNYENPEKFDENPKNTLKIPISVDETEKDQEKSVFSSRSRPSSRLKSVSNLIMDIYDENIEDDVLSEAPYIAKLIENRAPNPPPKTGYDSFCFKCHVDTAVLSLTCYSCKCSYHRHCARLLSTPIPKSPNDFQCIDCIEIEKAMMSNFNKYHHPKIESDMLKEMLLTILEKIRSYPDKDFFEEDIQFISWFEENIQPLIITQMSLKRIEEKIYGGYYKVSEQFLHDIRQLEHNWTIVDRNKLKSLKMIMKFVNTEINEMETCVYCFSNSFVIGNWFEVPCKRPHLLIWAKLRGFPYWPAKVMSFDSSKESVDVRFFGAHDRAWVPTTHCLLFTDKNMSNLGKISAVKSRNQMGITEALKEKDQYIKNMMDKYGFRFSYSREMLDPDNFQNQLEYQLPGLKIDKNSPNIKQINKNQTEKLTLKLIKSSDGKETDEKHPKVTDKDKHPCYMVMNQTKQPNCSKIDDSQIIKAVIMKKNIEERRKSGENSILMELEKIKKMRDEIESLNTFEIQKSNENIQQPKQKFPTFTNEIQIIKDKPPKSRTTKRSRSLYQPRKNCSSFKNRRVSTHVIPLKDDFYEEMMKEPLIPLPVKEITIKNIYEPITDDDEICSSSTKSYKNPKKSSIISISDNSNDGLEAFSKEPSIKDVNQAEELECSQLIQSILDDFPSESNDSNQTIMQIESESENEYFKNSKIVDKNHKNYAKSSKFDAKTNSKNPNFEEKKSKNSNFDSEPSKNSKNKAQGSKTSKSDADKNSKNRNFDEIFLKNQNFGAESSKNSKLEEKSFKNSRFGHKHSKILENETQNSKVSKLDAENNSKNSKFGSDPSKNPQKEADSSKNPKFGAEKHSRNQEKNPKIQSHQKSSAECQNQPPINDLTLNIPSNQESSHESPELSSLFSRNAFRMTDYFNSLLIDTIKAISHGVNDAQNVILKLENEKLNQEFNSLKNNSHQQTERLEKDHTIELKALKNSYEEKIHLINDEYSKEKVELTSEIQSRCESETKLAIEAVQKVTKRQTWCANCMKEARFYCCWNTSYCGVVCQKSHWQEHFQGCSNVRLADAKRRKQSNTTTTTRVEVKKTETVPLSGPQVTQTSNVKYQQKLVGEHMQKVPPRHVIIKRVTPQSKTGNEK